MSFATAHAATVPSDGPYRGGVFERKPVRADAEYKPVLPVTPRNKAWQQPAQFDRQGNSSQLVVIANPASASLRESLLRSQAPSALDTVESFERALIDALDVPGADPRLNETLGGVQAARFVIGDDRLSDEQRRELAAADPKDAAVKLQRYTVLRYASVKAALAAIPLLKSSGLFESVEMDIGMRLSSTPTDQFYGIPSAPTSVKYQWGLHAMRFADAWSRTRGHGYVGVIDAPIWNWQPGNLAAYNTIANTDLTANFRPQFASLSGYLVTTNLDWNPHSAHGRHVTGIVAAAASTSFRSLNSASPPTNAGTAGACPNCSVIFTGVQANGSGDTWLTVSSHVIDAIYKATRAGVQVINMSLNGGWEGVPPNTFSQICDGSVIDTATKFAVDRDVVVIASAGNDGLFYAQPRLPASCRYVLAVAAIELDPNILNVASSPAVSANWRRWISDEATLSVSSGNATVVPPQSASFRFGVSAPGRHIYSTFHPTDAYFPNFCGATTGYDLSPPGDAWGICSGTSMAAPHVSALAGILKSANPRAGYLSIVNTIKAAGHLSSPNVELGHGVPRADTALNALIPTSVPQNRLTPLFALYSATRQDFLYTSVPQMAIAAINGTLQPASSTGGTYSSVGNIPTIYSTFPTIPTSQQRPRAEAWVFTTPENPKNASIPLVPLFRLSFACNNSNYSNSSAPAECAANPANTDTTYTTEWAGVQEFESWGYRLDGVEGYIYPKTMTQPPGTVRLMRKYNASRDDHAIFPETLLTQMTNLGYTLDSGSDWLGYVYANPINGATPTIQ